jgi:hypothetical protein
MVALLLLTGCSSWIDQQPACEKDVYGWSDDLLGYVLTGDGSGEFDFDPDDVPRNSVAGSYDPSSGDFSYTTKYADSYYLVKAASTGFGTVFHDGDLDLLYDTVATDVLGVEATLTSRVQRTGCQMTVVQEDESGASFTMAGSYADDASFTWTTEDDTFTYQGTWRDNLGRSSQTEAKDGSYWVYTDWKPDGYADLEYTIADWWGNGYDGDGTGRDRFDGGEDLEYTITHADETYATVTSSFDYDGSGTVNASYADGSTCVYTYDADDNCSQACDGGSATSCN